VASGDPSNASDPSRYITTGAALDTQLPEVSDTLRSLTPLLSASASLFRELPKRGSNTNFETCIS
jgi:hypothetical protein